MQGARQAPQVNVRIPQELKDWLAHQSIDNRRSLNSEIVKRLEDSRARDEAADISKVSTQ